MPATFEHFGLHFLYPDNWEAMVDDDDQDEGVTLQLPRGGFCSILKDERPHGDDEIIDKIAAVIRADYGEMESEKLPVEPFFDEGLAVEMRFYYLDLLILARTLVTRLAGERFVIQFQAESRDFDANEQVFAAIVKQLRDGQGSTPPVE
ncbi:hypothetical protein [Novipirellula artificiosorum]|uniref:DUF1795 domain-containing protein n=1 Tax=Novipirellula artificiosorum TaxID=2528016 RepID=A0A5C6E0T4_9BACT|nr:hypothetical protein [Novipirellula artificiosorum]TWU42114.1 hypothetical protein Poly41_04100 [Novipirellula artificiosorum]